MPRIDPQQLLNCLSVLLATNGGIKSTKEVNRLVQLMGKFSKKLVSKCIYVQILKSTETELLGQFMADGGWALSHIWLQDGILTRNWPLVQELLELMLLCPVDVQRLKSNSAPKLVKGLSKEGGNEGVRILASKLVEQWLKIVKGESSVTPVTVQQQVVAAAVVKPEVPEVKEESTESGDDDEADDGSDDMVDPLEIPNNHVPEDDVDSKERISKAKSDGLVYKITLNKDGQQVFAKLEASPKKDTDTDRAKIKSELNNKTKNEEAAKGKSDPIAKLKIATVDGKKQIKDKGKQESVEPKEQDKTEANKKTEKAKSETVKEKHKSDDKERRSSKENTKESSDSKESKEAKEKRKDSSSKSLSSSKHNSSSSSKSSSHKSSRSSSDSKYKTSNSSSSSRDKSKDSEKDRDKDRDRSSKSSSSKSSSKSSSSSSSKSSQSKEKRDSTDEKVSQSMKDKDTLTKVIPPPINKLGKIPKKPVTADSEAAATEAGLSKKSSISIEVKKDAENRPKTVKTFNSKFRSHGLAEEAPPPPSRRGLQRPSSQPTVGASIPGTTLTKRLSPPPEKKDAVVPEKKLKVDTTLAAEKPGIKLIPAKPKTPVLVESDMFMDAIFASQTTKKDSTRKRKRLPSQSTSDTTKPEKVQSPDAKSVAPKFYQDTLDNETKDEDKADESKKKDGKDVEVTKTAEVDDEADVEMQEAPAQEVSVETEDTENVVVENKRPPGPGCGPNGPPGVLTILKRKGPKKQLRWKPQESLEEIHYFELDETERTNVSRNTVDPHQSMNEREGDAFLIVRKMNADDQMTEQISWRPLLIVDLVPAHPDGSASKEKKIQSDRELTCLRAIYFNRATIPESPAEPDMEHYQITDPAIIPLDDANGSPEGIKNFVGYAWPEPRGSPKHQPIGFEDEPPFNNFQPNFGFNNVPGWNNQPNILPPAFNGPPNLLNMNAMQPEPVNNMNMNPMNQMNQPFQQNQNFGPPNGMRNNNFNGNNFGNEGRNMHPGPPQNNQNWFRPNAPQNPQNNWRPPMGNNNNNNNNNNSNNRPRHDWNPRNICRAFAKGFCRHGDKCQWLHPGLNCPPFN